MKAAGNILKMDSVGRVLIPKTIRMQFDIKSDDCLEVFIDGENLVLRKYIPRCVFCGDSGDTITYMDKQVCKSCVEKFSEIH